jgi:hypothetical protein
MTDATISFHTRPPLGAGCVVGRFLLCASLARTVWWRVQLFFGLAVEACACCVLSRDCATNGPAKDLAFCLCGSKIALLRGVIHQPGFRVFACASPQLLINTAMKLG